MDTSRASELELALSRLLSCYCSLDARVLPLGCLLMHWATRARIVDVGGGILSPTAFLLMLIYYLQVEILSYGLVYLYCT